MRNFKRPKFSLHHLLFSHVNGMQRWL